MELAYQWMDDPKVSNLTRALRWTLLMPFWYPMLVMTMFLAWILLTLVCCWTILVALIQPLLIYFE